MTEVFVAGPEGPAKKNQWSLMTDSRDVAEEEGSRPGWTWKQVPPENLKPRRRNKRRGR